MWERSCGFVFFAGAVFPAISAHDQGASLFFHRFWLENIKRGKSPLTKQRFHGKIKHLSLTGVKHPFPYFKLSLAHFPEECKSRAKGF